MNVFILKISELKALFLEGKSHCRRHAYLLTWRSTQQRVKLKGNTSVWYGNCFCQWYKKHFFSLSFITLQQFPCYPGPLLWFKCKGHLHLITVYTQYANCHWVLSPALMATFESVSLDHTGSFLYAVIIVSLPYLIIIVCSPLKWDGYNDLMYIEVNYIAKKIDIKWLCCFHVFNVLLTMVTHWGITWLRAFELTGI